MAESGIPFYPQTLPAQTVVGRLGVGPGPSQAIPFSAIPFSALVLKEMTLRVFAVLGDSNVTGFGADESQMPAAIDGVLQYVEASNTIVAANYPVGVTDSGNFLPPMGNTIKAGTIDNVLLVSCGHPGSVVAAANDNGSGNWSPSGGTLNTAALASVAAAITKAQSLGYAISSVSVVFEAGINDTTVGAASITTTLSDIAAAWRVVYGATMMFYMIVPGLPAGADTTATAAVRASFNSIAAANFFNRIVYRNATDFYNNGLTSDAVHWTQAAHNDVGRVAGAAIISGGILPIHKTPLVFQPPSVLAAAETKYFAYNLGGAEAAVSVPLPFIGTLKSLYARTLTAAGSGQSCVFTVMKNSSATLLTCTISGVSATTANDTTHAVSFAPGDTISIKAVTSASLAANFYIGIGLEFDVGLSLD